MPDCYINIIREIDPTVDPEAVGNIADAQYRYFSRMTRQQWANCVNEAKRSHKRREDTICRFPHGSPERGQHYGGPRPGHCATRAEPRRGLMNLPTDPRSCIVGCRAAICYGQYDFS